MFSLLKGWYQRHFSQPGTIEFALVLVCAFITVYYFMWLVGPIVVALCIAFCLDWAVEALQHLARLSRHCAASLVMLLFCSLVVFITILIVPNVIKQGAEFYNAIVAFSTNSLDQDEYHLKSDYSKLNPCNINTAIHFDDQNAHITIDSEIPASSPDAPLNSEGEHTIVLSHDSAGLTGANADEISRSLMERLSSGNSTSITAADFDHRVALEINDIVINLPEPIPSMVSFELIERTVRNTRINTINQMAMIIKNNLMPSVVNAFTWLMYLIIVPIFTFLMLYNKQELQRRVKLFILPNNQVLIRRFWPSIHQQIAGYIRGKILHIIIISIANSSAFVMMGVNYAMLLGVGVGLSVVIPYVGAVIIAVPVILVAVLQFGFSTTLLWVLVIYTVIQLLDSNALTPMLFSKAMNLDAFSILAAILIFGGLWGFWGVFFAIPLATFIKTIIIGWPNASVQRVRKKSEVESLDSKVSEANEARETNEIKASKEAKAANEAKAEGKAKAGNNGDKA